MNMNSRRTFRRPLAATVAVVLLVSVAGMLVPTSAASPQTSPGKDEWRVAWATSMHRTLAPSPWTAHPTAPGTPTGPEVTYRFIVRPTVSGSAPRLRFSNPTDSSSATGSQPVTFGSVEVATRASGADLVPGTTQQVTFGGGRRVTIPPDGWVLSDPLARTVSRFTDLAVSVYVPEPTIPPLDPQTYVTQYATAPFAGDRTADEPGAPFSQVQEPIYWLDGLYTLTRSPRAIVAIGDSITDGDQGPSYTDDFGMDRYPTWPDFLARRIANTTGSDQASVINAGVNGDTAAGVAERLVHDVLEHRGVTDVILEIGTNDVTSGASAPQIISDLQEISMRLHRHGLRVIGATLVPRRGWATNSAAQDAVRADVNPYIRTCPIFDEVLDIAAAVGLPGDDNLFQPGYDSGDHLHPNTAGYQAIAESLNLRFLKGN